MEIRVSQGVGSSPKWWLVLKAGNYRRQIGEVDMPTETAPVPTAILWGPYREIGGPMCWDSPLGPLGLTGRERYESLDEVVEFASLLWPDAEIIRDDEEPQDWL